MKQNRRKFIINSALTLAASSMLCNKLLAETYDLPKGKGLTILFQGDSITDAGRSFEQSQPNTSLGFGPGFVFQASAQLLAENPNVNFQIYNRGNAGNRVAHLADRWENDTLKIKPDVISILVGVNDYWQKLNLGYNGTVAKYESEYRALLTRTKKKLPHVKLIICEPFAIWGGSGITDRWKYEFPVYQESAAKLAKEFDALFIPFQVSFDKVLKTSKHGIWSPDGIHPSPAGAYLMAQTWIKHFKKNIL